MNEQQEIHVAVVHIVAAKVAVELEAIRVVFNAIDARGMGISKHIAGSKMMELIM